MICVPGVDNVLVDSLSRETLDNSEWMLNKEVFQMICQKFRTPEVDLFASESNYQVLNFLSRGRNTKAMGLDVLSKLL